MPIRFGEFSLDPARGTLVHRGRPVEIQRKPFEVLLLLVERAGELVTRDQLYERLWPDGTYVDFEHGLNTVVRKLRRALGETSESPRCLETVTGRGYRFHLGLEAPKAAGGSVLAMRVEESREASLREFEDSVALWRGESMEPAPPALVARFPSVDDAVRCAVGLVQRSRTGSPAARLRIGLGDGAASRSEALRLCAAAGPGQTLAAASLVGALAIHDGLRVRDHAQVVATGAAPLAVVSLEASALPPAAWLGRPPFVGRSAELAGLTAMVEALGTGRGGFVLLSGEPGIGKTRLIEELALRARRAGTIVLIGRCMEAAAPSQQPLADALLPYLYERERDELRATLPVEAAAVVARLVPALRERLADLPDPPALRPDEERLRLLDALAQLFAAIAKRAPVLLAFDDLHWADSFTAAILAHLARAAARAPLLVLGSLRDTASAGGEHPLARMLQRGELEAGSSFALAGLDAHQVHRWLEAVAPGRSSEATAAKVQRVSGGNPFFVRELLLGWAGRLRNAPPGAEASLQFDASSVPSLVLELVEQRLTTLSEPARRLLTAASAVGDVFRADVVARAAALDDDAALDALDESYGARLVRAAGGIDDSEFSHALIREVLYDLLAPAQRARLHRRLALELSRAGGASPAAIAEQYHRSRELSGAEPGADFALEAASHAELSVDFDAAVQLLRMALDLLPQSDPRRARALHRLALALGWTGAASDGVAVASQAGAAIAAQEGPAAAAAALADAADAIWLSSFSRHAWELGTDGLRYAGARRDEVWARLASLELRKREAQDEAGIPGDDPLRHEISDILLRAAHGQRPFEQNEIWRSAVFESRADAIVRASHVATCLGMWAGEYRRALTLFRDGYRGALKRGQTIGAAIQLASAARMEIALGELDEAGVDLARANSLMEDSTSSAMLPITFAAVEIEFRFARGNGLAPMVALTRALLEGDPPEIRWLRTPARATLAWLHAQTGRIDEGLRELAIALPQVDRAPRWMANLTTAIDRLSLVLWSAGGGDATPILERNVRRKVVEPDFRSPGTDGRLSLARLCALDHRYDEATRWFARARSILDEQGARPLRAITDFDEAWMYLRRAAPGDRDRALPLLDAAVAQFEAIGMPGWVRRADELARG